MAKNQFVHLHCHTGGSVLDGHANVKEMVEEAAKLGQPAIASTDHGTMHFSYDLWNEAKAAGIKGIVGIEAYMTPGDASRTEKEPIFFGARSKEERMEGAQDVSAGGAYTHMTMLAENNEGMHNLFKLSSLAWADGYYKKPRMDIEIVSQYSKGIIATTGCPSGELQTRLRLGQWDEAVKYVDKMQSIFGKENYFLELMDHDMKVDIERVVRDDLLKIGKHMNIPLLATNDLHYTRRDQARSHEQMLAVQSGSKMTDATYDNGGKRFAFDGDEFYVKSADEMEAVFGHLPESITNTLWIAERCNVSFEYKDDLRPNVEFPAGMSETEFIKSEAFEGLHRRLPQFANDQRYIDRLNMELGVLDMKGYNGYFLVTSDFVRWAKNNEIKKVETGYGRGSAGGSLVSFCLDITDLDPIRFDLLFERFINPERDSPPDIDMDFDDIGRDRVIKYVTEKYGSDKVAQIVTFGRIKAKNAIKDVIRILDEPYALGDILTKQLPPDVAGKAIKLYEVFDKNHPRYHEGENFREAVSKLENKNIIPSALGLEGRMRSTGVHAAGVIISSKNLVETIPLFTRQKDNLTITAFDYPTCESLGLLKFDFLGIRNLTIVAKAMEHIKRIHGIELDAVDIVTGPMDDKKTYELFQKGETLGIFQLDSAGMRSLLKIFNPTEIGDISAILALYRPGPMGMNSHIAYADRKNGRAPILPLHKELEEPLKDVIGDTFNVLVYQEQLMKAAQVLAGYTLAQADNLRRAMGKKKKEVLDKEYIPFSEGMAKNGYSKEAIKTVWDIFIPFAEYGFNKSHSAGYALLSYVTAYLKANYPAEYMSALLSCTMTDKDKTATYLEECRRMGIKVSPPHVSKSLIEYTPVSEKEILIGMEAIRGVGYEVAKGIMEAAQEEPFESLTDFMSRVPSHALSKGVIEGLIDAGGFDSFGYTRRSLASCLPDLARNFSKQKKTEEKGQFDLFSMMEEVSVPEIDIPSLPEYSKKDKLARERHVLGLYVSDHPLSGMADTLDSYVSNHIVDIATGDLVASEGFGDRKAKVAFAGVVGNLVRKPSRKGDMFASFTIEDMTGIVDAVMFPKSYEQFGHLLEPDGIIVARGSLMLRGEDEVNFAIDSIEPIETTHSGEIPFVIKLQKEQTTEESLNALGDVLQRYKGEQKVQIHVTEETEIKVYELDESFKVKVAQGLRNEITYLFGLNWM